MSSNYPIGRADPDDNKNQRFWAGLQGVIALIARGFPTLAKFLGGARVSVPFVKTDVGLRLGLEVTSNEAANEAGVFVFVTGGAAQANRIVDIGTAESGVAFGGKLRLNHFGGDVEVGILGTTTLATVAAGATTLTQPATGTKTFQVIAVAGSTANLWEMNASAITNAEIVYGDKNGHLAIAQALPPTGVLGTGAGTGAGTAPVLTIVGTDQGGVIQIITGTQVPAAAAAIVTMTFKTAMATAPTMVHVQFANGAAQALARNQDPVAVTYSVNGWVLFGGAAALAISTTYQWSYWVL